MFLFRHAFFFGWAWLLGYLPFDLWMDEWMHAWICKKC